MKYQKENPWGAVVGVVLFVIGLVILLPLMFFGTGGCKMIFMLLTGHPM